MKKLKRIQLQKRLSEKYLFPAENPPGHHAKRCNAADSDPPAVRVSPLGSELVLSVGGGTPAGGGDRREPRFWILRGSQLWSRW